MITKRIVPENERLNFYPSISDKYIHVEAFSYRLAECFIDGYDGGYYDFIEIRKGNEQAVFARYTCLVTDELVRLVNPMNYSDVTLSSDGAGVALFLMLYSEFANRLYESSPSGSEHFATLFHQLREYALLHNESDKILAFID